MKERYLGFLFCAIFLGYAVNWGVDWVHGRYLSESLWFQSHWMLPFIALPAALMLALAFAMGFFRKGRARAWDLLAVATVAALIYLMLGAGYACWHYCF